MPDISYDVRKAASDVAGLARDVVYVVIGAGVLGFQRAQVQRQEINKRLAQPRSEFDQRWSAVRTDLGDTFLASEARLQELADRLENVIDRVVFRPAYSDAQAGKAIADGGDDRTQAVVSAVAAERAHAQLSERQIHLVDDDQHAFGRRFVPRRDQTHGRAGEIHVRRRLHQDEAASHVGGLFRTVLLAPACDT